MPLALEMRGASKRYVAGIGGCIATVNVLRSVDLVICAGETVAIVGPPGAGKSTLLLVAAGLLVPDSGDVLWFGDASRAAAVRHTLYHVPGTRMPTRQPTQSFVHLVDDPDALGAAEVARVGRWINQRAEVGESVLFATRHRTTALSLASRVYGLAGGVLRGSVVATAPRVAEEPRARRSATSGSGD
jgi:ABC-type sulfate/molybdate transport systems ATPase subunit